MRNSSQAATDPWAADIDNGWRDLVISSAPPPPPRPPREATELPVRNRPLPADLRTWQEHGAPRVPSGEHPVEEPSFAGDRRLWIVAGTLMAMAAMVLALLGYLTFGGLSAPVVEAAPPAPAAAPVAATPAPEPAHARRVERHHVAAADGARVTAGAGHAAKHGKRARHRKR